MLLDVDALGRVEGESWVWQGSQLLKPGYGRALVELSRGGADASVVREFDLTALAFVDNGFALPEAKSIVGWIDADTVYVGTDVGEGSMTSSGYPRTVRKWRRGTPVEESEPVFEGDATDVFVYATHDPTPGFERDLVVRAAGLLPARPLPAGGRRAAPHRRAAGRRRRPAPRVDAGAQPQRVDRRRGDVPGGFPARHRPRRVDGRGAPRRGAVRAGRPDRPCRTTPGPGTTCC